MSYPHDPQSQPQYAAPASSGGLNGLGLASLIIGIVALGVSWLPFVGLIGIVVGIVGIVLGILGMALGKYRGRRVLAIVGTVVSGLGLLLSFVLPWITGTFWLFGIVEDSGIIEELESWTPAPTPSDEGWTAPADPADTTAPTESTPAVPTESVTP